MSTLLLLLTALAASSSISSSKIPVSSLWQPWAWTGWEKFPSLYFAAEPTGHITNNDTLSKIANFSLAMFEFRMGQFIENPGWANLVGEDFSQQQCAILAEVPNAPPCFVYRSGMWAGYYYTIQNSTLDHQNYFLESDVDDLCRSEMGFADFQKTGRKFCRYDFRHQPTKEKLAHVLQEVSTERHVKGIFLDNAESVSCDGTESMVTLGPLQRAAVQNATWAAWRAAIAQLIKGGGYPVISTTNQFSQVTQNYLVPWEHSCPRKEEELIASLEGLPFARNLEFFMWQLNSTCSAQLQNMIIESQKGIPVFVHMPWFPDDHGCLGGCKNAQGRRKEYTEGQFLELGIAAFLIGMGKGSYFGFSNMQDKNDKYDLGGWADVSWLWHEQYHNLHHMGHPKDHASMDASKMVFEREFDNGHVTVDCATGSYAINFPGFIRNVSASEGVEEVPLLLEKQSRCVDIHGIKRCLRV